MGCPWNGSCVRYWSIVGLVLLVLVSVAWNGDAMRDASHTLQLVHSTVEHQTDHVEASIQITTRMLQSMNDTDVIQKLSDLIESMLAIPFDDEETNSSLT